MACHDLAAREEPTLFIEPLDEKCRVNRQFVIKGKIRGRNPTSDHKQQVRKQLVGLASALKPSYSKRSPLPRYSGCWPRRKTLVGLVLATPISGTERVRAHRKKSMKMLLFLQFPPVFTFQRLFNSLHCPSHKPSL